MTSIYRNAKTGKVVQATRWEDGRYCYRAVKDGRTWGRVFVASAEKFEAEFSKVE